MPMNRLLLIIILLGIVLTVTAQDNDKTLPGEGEVVEETTTESDIDFDILDDEDLIADMLEQGDVEIELDDLIFEIEFDDTDDWENYEDDSRSIEVDDGVYTAEIDDTGIIWGQNFEDFDNGIISAVIAQDGGSDDNGYGIMCRANPDNNIEGYHFWISGEGSAAIVIYEDGEGYDELEGWEDFDAINTDGPNVMHVVCVDEYLALYINGELILETEDDTYDEGETGLSLRNFDNNDAVSAIFDDVHIWEASD